MNSLAGRLLDAVEADPKVWVVVRNRENYDKFLNLFLDLSYPNVHTSQISSWRRRTHTTWALQDRLVPGNCTGGTEDGQVVSTIGALPICQKILYVHSGAMQRTLKAAVSLFAATHCTFDVMAHMPAIEYWMGLYTYASRFVTAWQRPASFAIPEQIEIEEIRVYPSRIKIANANDAGMHLVPADGPDFGSLSNTHRAFAEMLLEDPERFREVYKSRAYSVRGAEGSQFAIALICEGPDEFTAFNVCQWAFIIPAREGNLEPGLINALRGCELLRHSVLRVLTHQRVNAEGWDSAGCQFVPAFIALTPRSQLHWFRRSLREAFLHLLEKYSDRELGELIDSGNQEEVENESHAV